MRRVFASLLLVLSMLWPLASAAAVPEVPRFRLIAPEQGLPSVTVKVLARDRSGYVWIGTEDGLARYDGVGMRVWRHDPADPQSLRGNNVQALYIDSDDTIWVGVEGGGVSVISPDRRRVQHVVYGQGSGVGADVFAITGDADAVWIGTYDAGLYRRDRRGRITHFDMRAGLPSNTVMSLAIALDQRVWVGTDAGLAVGGPAGFTPTPLPDAESAPMVFGIGRFSDGTLWAGTSSGVYLQTAHGTWRQPPWSPMFVDRNSAMALARDPDGSLWIGSLRGLWRQRGNAAPIPVQHQAGMAGKPVETLLQQPGGGLWAPIPGAGLGYLRSDWQRTAQLTRAPLGLSADLYPALSPARDGGLWLGAHDGTLQHLRPDGVVQAIDSEIQRSLNGNKLTAIVETPDGTLWITHRSGLIRLATDGRVDQWDSKSARDPTPAGGVIRMGLTAQGQLWLSTLTGGLQWRDARSGQVLQEYRSAPTSADGGADDALADADQVALGPDGQPWTAGHRGLHRYDARSRQFVPVLDGNGKRFYLFGFDGPEQVWVQTLEGLQRYRRTGGAWQAETAADARVGQREGLPAVGGAGMVIDAAHRVWISTKRGLFRWDPQQRRLQRFGVQEGLKMQEFVDRAIALTPDGLIAASTADGGVLLVDANAKEPAAHASHVAFDGYALRRAGAWEVYPLPSMLRLPWSENEFRLQARLLDFDEPQSNRYWFKVDGFDRDWVDVGSAGERVLTRLPPGRHVVQLRAIDAAGNAAPEQRLLLDVQPPWWLTWWARTGALLLLVLTIVAAALIYRERIRRRHAWALAEQQRRLAEQASEAKTHFLATLGHEVRTPMTGVLGMTELLLRGQLQPRQRSQVEAIQRAGQHLLRLVNDALDIARIEAGKLELTIEPFDLSSMLQDVAAIMAPLAERKGLQFRLDIPADLPSLWNGDAQRLRQILMNLLGNACRFTEQGSVGLWVQREADGLLCFGVHDTGPGVSEEQRTRLFRRFEQAEGERTRIRYGGSGLGLAISQELAAAMGGRIDLDSTPGVGTTFRVCVPLKPATPAQAQTATTHSVATSRALNVLLVEDDATIAEVIAGLLAADGHRSVHAMHGLAALTDVANGTFDIALLDLDLPGMDGVSLARQLRRQGFDRPLLAVTARADGDAEAQTRAAGFDGFLRKPLTGDLLREAMQAAMAARAAV